MTTRLRFRRLEMREGYLEQRIATNIGAGGLFVPTSVPWSLGTLCELEFTIPSQSEAVRVLGRVIWESVEAPEPGMGVAFVRLDPSVRDDLVRLAQRGDWKTATSPR
ncbi:MAG: PilZ domain-containing protein [Planctomycetes bacterium]|nr:PilZ domain-containing protein [Planctomycetota bacterium]